MVYTALGAKALPKEYIEVHCDGVSCVIDDFRELRVVGGRGGWRGVQDKGHKAEMAAFVRYVTEGGESPISLEEMVQVTRTSFKVHRQQSRR